MQSTTYRYLPAPQSLLRSISCKGRQTGSICSLGPGVARLRRKGPRKRYPKSPPKSPPKRYPKRYPKSPPKRYPKRVCLLKLVQNQRPAQHMKIIDSRSSGGTLFPPFSQPFSPPFSPFFHHPFTTLSLVHLILAHLGAVLAHLGSVFWSFYETDQDLHTPVLAHFTHNDPPTLVGSV